MQFDFEVKLRNTKANKTRSFFGSRCLWQYKHVY